jgi:hypothetical protein
MKTAMYNFRMALVTLTAVFTFLFGNTVQASGEEGDCKAELHFVNNAEKKLIFRLVLNNNSNACYVVTVADKNGDIIFAEKVSGTNISRIYKLNVENINVAEGTTFSVTNKTTKETTLYKVNSLVNVLDSAIVAKK